MGPKVCRMQMNKQWRCKIVRLKENSPSSFFQTICYLSSVWGCYFRLRKLGLIRKCEQSWSLILHKNIQNSCTNYPARIFYIYLFFFCVFICIISEWEADDICVFDPRFCVCGAWGVVEPIVPEVIPQILKGTKQKHIFLFCVFVFHIFIFHILSDSIQNFFQSSTIHQRHTLRYTDIRRIYTYYVYIQLYTWLANMNLARPQEPPILCLLITANSKWS